MSKPVDEAYKQRLADWVKAQIRDKELSQRDFALLVGSSLGAVQHWMGRRIKTSLTHESIEGIARYRSMTAEQVKAWLEGREPRESLSLEERIEQLEKRVQLLEGKHSMADLQNFRGPGAVVNLIRHEIADQGFDPDTPEGLQEFIMCLPTVEDDEVEAIRSLIERRAAKINNDDWLFAIALALKVFTGGRYNLRMLQVLDASATNGDRHAKQL